MSRSPFQSAKLANIARSLAAGVAVAFCSPSALAQQQIITLKSSMTVGPGFTGEIPSVNEAGFGQKTGDAKTTPIAIVDDKMRVTIFAKVNIAQVSPSESQPEIIDIPQSVAPEKSKKFFPGRPLAVTPFNEFGRRVFTAQTPTGTLDVFQGITEISPLYIQLEALRADNAVEWRSYLAFNSVPFNELDRVLRHRLDLREPTGWYRMVRLYSQADRYREARLTLAEAMTRLGPEFPGEVESMTAELKRLDQQYAAQMFKEVEVRINAGQPKLAMELLQQFPMDRLAIETQLKAQDKLAALKQRAQQVTDLAAALKQLSTQLSAEDQKVVMPAVDEIVANLSTQNVDRMADFARLRDDNTLSADQRVALALGGWWLGAGSGVDNLAVARALQEAEQVIREYLRTTDANNRQALLGKLRATEAGVPKYVAGLLANMPPPRDLPDPIDPKLEGFYRVTVPATNSVDQDVEYYVQLPPEYDSRRKYPTVLTLHGRSTPATQQIDWWAGPYSETLKARGGAATRNGYIVVAPAWTVQQQERYFGSETEHDRVLRCLRDAMRRCSIDTDRVFISGHDLGGEAAWDIALAHPDLFAGLVGISAFANQFAIRYRDNAQSFPSYFVFGETIGVLSSRAGAELNEYVTSRKFDSMLVKYKGRGPGNFQEELPRIMQWMNLASHKRQPFPKEIKVSTNRAGDRFFWWIEAIELFPNVQQHPLMFNPKDPNQGEFEANITDVASNGVRVTSVPAKRYVVWLHPDMVDFTKPVRIDLRGEGKRVEVQPDIETILEDTRTRGDRQHPFWARFDSR